MTTTPTVSAREGRRRKKCKCGRPYKSVEDCDSNTNFRVCSGCGIVPARCCCRPLDVLNIFTYGECSK